MKSSYPSSLILLHFVVGFLLSPFNCKGWVSHTSCSSHPGFSMSSKTRSLDAKSIPEPSSSLGRLQIILASSTSSASLSVASDDASLSVASDDDEDDDGDEYEYVEYDILTEKEFMGSEWLVGTVMDNRGEKIAETWCRFATDKDGKNVAIWGDKSTGDWNFDTANQFLSVSKSAPWGKNIWAGVVDDYYFCRGTVRGWNFFASATVVGQWQARRLGVEKDEAGEAPWFQEDEDELELPEPDAAPDSASDSDEL